MEITTVVLALFSLVSASWSLDIAMVINCTDSEVKHNFSTIHNLAIVYNGAGIVLIEEGGHIEINETVKIASDIKGEFSRVVKYISGTIKTRCKDVDKAKCKVFGKILTNKTREIVYTPQVECHNLDYESAARTDSDFSFQLFLTSIFLVHIPFIFAPFIWCGCSHCSERWREIESRFRYVSVISTGGVLVVFVISWISFLRDKTTIGKQQYITFSVTEGVFIFLYMVFKLIFKVVEPKVSDVSDKRYQALRQVKDIAYNGCVATSLGAVITPITCWLMIRQSPCCDASYDHTISETIFWMFAVFSVLSYIFVSHKREQADWKKYD